MGGRHGESESAAPPLENGPLAARRLAPAAAASLRRHAPATRLANLRSLARRPNKRTTPVAVDALTERVERVVIFRAVVRQADDPVVRP